MREDELNFENSGKPLDKQVRFSMKDAIEETRDLIAVHNLDGDQLAHNDKPIVAAFQSTLPTRGSDMPKTKATLMALAISIHAPRKGERQSIWVKIGTRINYFNPRSPQGGATPDSYDSKTDTIVISIHAPRKGERPAHPPQGSGRR